MALSALEQTQLAVVAFVKLPQTGGRIAGNAFGVASARCVLRGIDVDDGIRAPPGGIARARLGRSAARPLCPEDARALDADDVTE